MIPTTASSGSSSSSSCNSKQAIPESRTSVQEECNLLKDAFDQEFEAELNEILFDILKQIDSSTTFEQVSSGLLEQGYDLTQNEDGSLKMTRHLYVFQKIERHQALAAFMSDFLPSDEINSSSACEQQIEFSDRNVNAILDSLRSGEITLKEKIIRDAITQGEELFLNGIIETMFRNGEQLDLSHIDLSRADLRKVNLIFDYANLTNANLDQAQFGATGQ